MDIPRPDQARKRRRKRILWGSASLLTLVLVTVGLSRLEPAAPTVEKSSVLMDTVKRGELPRQVRGNGTLIPEEIRWIPAQNAGRVERILVQAGAAVTADTCILELSNPELMQTAFDAEWAFKAAEAELANLRVQLDTQRLNQQAVVASSEANYHNAKLEYEVNDALAKSGLVPALVLKQSQTKAEELYKLSEIEHERLKIIADAVKAQLAVAQAKVEQSRALLDLKRQQVENLKVRASIDGVLQKVGETTQLQEGQQITAGSNLARVADPKRLKAEIKIPEVQARDIELGQKAFVDTRNGIIPGRVIRIDPAAQSGTRTVDVKLEGALPRGAVPDLSVDGTIELERLNDVMFVGPPVGGHAESTVGLFKVIDGGKGAVRVPVKLGRGSVSAIEVIEGLQVGDQIILSDMSQWDAHDRVRLN
ncbi:MAG: efflux RND transporter periplasmic adaptor subunit [Verrucomicrobia bacterium]|nr:efflux RND transporter periplasmic adaptor subunit [Verrucomicrobiota bacterium]